MDASENSATVTTAVCGMVTDGTYSRLDFLYVFAINSQANAKLNWASTSFPATTNGTVSFTANAGYTGDGSSFYITNGYTPSSSGQMTTGSASLGVCQLTNESAGNTDNWIGGNNGGEWVIVSPFGSGNVGYDLNDSAFPSFTYSSILGQWTATRTGTSTMALYQNGSSVATSSATSSTLVNTTITIFAENDNGTIDHFSSTEMAFAFGGAGLTGTQVTAIYNRLHTYLGAVGAPSGC
jgi:hypothetical protein